MEYNLSKNSSHFWRQNFTVPCWTVLNMVLWTWHWNLIKTNCLFIDTRKKHNILLHIKTTTTCEKREAWVFRQPLVATELIWIFKKRFCVLFSYRPFLWLCSYTVGGVGIVEEYIVWKVFIHLFIIQRQVTTTSTFNIFHPTYSFPL